MRLAFFSPLRPVPSGISDYSEELLPHLAQHAEITLFVDGFEPASPSIREQFHWHDVREFDALHRARPYDVCLYQMGNHPCHLGIYRVLERYPGIVVLHDYVLHDFMRYLCEVEGDEEAYLAGFPEGEGAVLFRRLRAGIWSELDHFAHPGIRRVVETSRAVIVHTETAQRQVLQQVPGARVHMVPMYIGPDASPFQGLPRAEVKRRLGLRPDDLVVGTFGFVSPSKRLHAALAGFREFLKECLGAHYLVVGADNPGFSSAQLVHDLGLDGLVRITGRVPWEEFYGLMDATDVCIQLRYPSAGEMSASILRVMSKGKPVLLTHYGQFREFPDDCCLKVDLGPAEVPMIAAYLRLLAEDPALRRRIGENALQHVRVHNAVERTIAGYMQAIQAAIK